MDASRHFSFAAGLGVEHLNAASRAGLFAIDRSIVEAATGWRASLIDAPHLGQAVNAVGGSVAAAIAARQTFLSDGLEALRQAGWDTRLGITGGAEYLDQLRSQLGESYRIFARHAEITHEVLLGALRPAAAAATLDWGRRWREFDNRQRHFATELQRDGWMVLPDWPVNRSGRLVALRRREGKVALNRAICGLYNANDHRALRRMVEAWNDEPAFRSRRPIIREALKLHREGRFKASIPMLLPHVEGVLADVFAPGTQQVNAATLYKEGVDADRLQGLLVEGLVQTLELVYGYLPFAAFRPRSRRLHRHAIAHGRALNYGSEVNSLKVFLLLDHVAAEVRSKREADEAAEVA
jgi:hypothetical protein